MNLFMLFPLLGFLTILPQTLARRDVEPAPNCDPASYQGGYTNITLAPDAPTEFQDLASLRAFDKDANIHYEAAIHWHDRWGAFGIKGDSDSIFVLSVDWGNDVILYYALRPDLSYCTFLVPGTATAATMVAEQR